MAEMIPEDATPIPPDWRWVDTEHGRRLRDANNFNSDVIVPTGDGGFIVDPEQERIIALAPKLQAACEWLLPHFEEAVRDGGDHFEQRFCEEVVKRLRDALAPHV
jgi:hypothetical protein